MVDDNMLVLKGGSTKSEKVGFEDIWEPLDDYEAPYREPLLPPDSQAPYTEPLLTTKNLGEEQLHLLSHLEIVKDVIITGLCSF